MGPAPSPTYTPKRNLGRFRAYAYTYMYHMFWTQAVLSGLLFPVSGDKLPMSTPLAEDSDDDDDKRPAAKQAEEARRWVQAVQEEKNHISDVSTDVMKSAIRRYQNRSEKYLCVRKRPSHLSDVCGTGTPKQTVRGMSVTTLNESEAPPGAVAELSHNTHFPEDESAWIWIPSFKGYASTIDPLNG